MYSLSFCPNTLGILKIPSALYIFYFAYKIAKSKPQDLESNSNNDSLGFFNAFFLQLINVKIILYVITIHISFVLPYYQSLFIQVLLCFILLSLGIVEWLLWVIASIGLKNFLVKHYKITNLTMAILLTLSAIEILIDQYN
ncbi:hypothetical protein LS72_000275 [Helicobacter apodemus]|uniref:Uncharacterized protein n=1 Tax=Helicobacter apodemus TaxID=135569 RepID=A0A4U8UHI0_9HELI|nr:hypothetical protein LS72_000275 [Helicobacter apodemus]